MSLTTYRQDSYKEALEIMDAWEKAINGIVFIKTIPCSMKR